MIHLLTSARERVTSKTVDIPPAMRVMYSTVEIRQPIYRGTVKYMDVRGRLQAATFTSPEDFAAFLERHKERPLYSHQSLTI